MYCAADAIAQVCRGLRPHAPLGSRPGSVARSTMQNWEASSFWPHFIRFIMVCRQTLGGSFSMAFRSRLLIYKKSPLKPRLCVIGRLHMLSSRSRTQHAGKTGAALRRKITAGKFSSQTPRHGRGGLGCVLSFQGTKAWEDDRMRGQTVSPGVTYRLRESTRNIASILDSDFKEERA